METKFKVGDLVKCIDPGTNWHIQKDVKYTVKSVNGLGEVNLDGVGDGFGFYYPSRFELVAEKQTDPGTVTNSLGGKQSDTGTRFDLVPPRAIHEVAGVLKRGAEKYGENNWHAISTKEHLEHLIRHAYLWLRGDTTEDHLANVACRSLMALEIDRMGGPVKNG